MMHPAIHGARALSASCEPCDIPFLACIIIGQIVISIVLHVVSCFVLGWTSFRNTDVPILAGWIRIVYSGLIIIAYYGLRIAIQFCVNVCCTMKENMIVPDSVEFADPWFRTCESRNALCDARNPVWFGLDIACVTAVDVVSSAASLFFCVYVVPVTSGWMTWVLYMAPVSAALVSLLVAQLIVSVIVVCAKQEKREADDIELDVSVVEA